MEDQYHLLGLGPAASIIAGFELSVPRCRVLVRGMYDPVLRVPYQILFSECTELQFTYTEDFPKLLHESTLVGILLGERAHKSPAIITTDDFELSILYQDFQVTK
jgi:hypothetical protein